jgi:hypothetical protein
MDDGYCICPVLCVFCCMDVCRCMRDHVSEKFENTAAHPAGHDGKVPPPSPPLPWRSQCSGEVLTRRATAGQRLLMPGHVESMNPDGTVRPPSLSLSLSVSVSLSVSLPCLAWQCARRRAERPRGAPDQHSADEQRPAGGAARALGAHHLPRGAGRRRRGRRLHRARVRPLAPPCPAPRLRPCTRRERDGSRAWRSPGSRGRAVLTLSVAGGTSRWCTQGRQGGSTIRSPPATPSAPGPSKCGRAAPSTTTTRGGGPDSSPAARIRALPCLCLAAGAAVALTSPPSSVPVRPQGAGAAVDPPRVGQGGAAAPRAGAGAAAAAPSLPPPCGVVAPPPPPPLAVR